MRTKTDGAIKNPAPPMSKREFEALRKQGEKERAAKKKKKK